MSKPMWIAGSLIIAMVVGCNNSNSDSPDGQAVDVGGGGYPGESGFAAGGVPGAGSQETQVETASIPVTNGIATLNGENTRVAFTGTKPDGTRHIGGFKELKGEVAVEGEMIKSISVEITTASLWSDADRLSNHLKSPDFFNVNDYPTAIFKSNSIEGSEEGSVNITGDLTLLGATESVSFPAKVTLDESGVIIEANFKLDRTKFGMNYKTDEIDTEVAMALAVGVSTSPPDMSANEQGGGGPGGGGPGGRGRGGFDPAAMFAEWDQDGDGKLAGDEIPDRMKERGIENIDTDKDGAVSKLEWEERMRQFRSDGGGGGRGGPRGRGPTSVDPSGGDPERADATETRSTDPASPE